ncbi:hypothetical protein [Poriferisphaera sp. WC338]|uniref:hypothetical protein n=1 Tax=Poriferisphaera sp. WC338 TaxID=3425129 RepID=UPI003D81B3A5
MNATPDNNLITFHCHACHVSLTADASQAGRVVTCSECGAMNVAPASPSQTTAAEQTTSPHNTSLDDTDFNLTAITEDAMIRMPQKHNAEHQTKAPAFSAAAGATIAADQSSEIVGPPVYLEPEPADKQPLKLKIQSLPLNFRAYLLTAAAAIMILVIWIGLYMITAQPLAYLAPIFALMLALLAREQSQDRTKTFAAAVTTIAIFTIFITRIIMATWAFSIVAPQQAAGDLGQLNLAVGIEMMDKDIFSADIRDRLKQQKTEPQQAGEQQARAAQKLAHDIDKEIQIRINGMTPEEKLQTIQYLIRENKTAAASLHSKYSPGFNQWDIIIIPLAAIFPLLLCMPPRRSD